MLKKTKSNIPPPLNLGDLEDWLVPRSSRAQRAGPADLTEREVDALREGAKLIPITKGKFAIVDAENYEALSKHLWVARLFDKKCYAQIQVRQILDNRKVQVTTIRMHGIVLGIKGIVDHRNGDGLDNRKQNLRPASTQQNLCNRGPNKNNTSGFKGVGFDKRYEKFTAEILYNRKKKFLGLFSNPIEAAIAYDNAALKFHGEFALTNQQMFPEKFIP